MFASLNSKKFRQIFLIFFSLGSILPMLIILFILHRYIYPELTVQQVENLRDIIAAGLGGMLVIPLLGLAMMVWWIKSLENLTAEVKDKSAALMGIKSPPSRENEMVVLREHFEGLYGELQDKIQQLTTYSNRLIDHNIKLSELAITDELTTLFNRRHLEDRLDEEISRASRYGHDLTMVMMDVDGFKQYNDEFGHPAGDRLLRDLGLSIKKNIRKSDLAFRYGGDEFCVLLPQCGVRDGAVIARKLIKTVVGEALAGQGRELAGKISLSCGVAAFTRNKTEFLAMADRCLYQAKSSGKGKVVFLEGKEER
ncbi:MAG: GGDEF domain-containing protein [Pseudomonadota bacterium]